MAVSDDRKYSKGYIFNLLESVKGKTLGEVDKANVFAITNDKPKITGIAGMVVEQSVFGYEKDSKQECDINIDGELTELKVTGVRVYKNDLKKAKGKTGDSYNCYLHAKEGISVTAVTLKPTIQQDFETSHFWEKARRMLIVFYEYQSYSPVLASEFADFPIVDYCYNTFSENEKAQLRNDWELVRDYLKPYYDNYKDEEERNRQLDGFTSKLRGSLLLIELVPKFKKAGKGSSYVNPRYRLKQSFVDYIVQGHFDKSRKNHEIQLKESFSSFAQLDQRCHRFTEKYGGMTFVELKETLGITSSYNIKAFTAECVLRMFDADCKELNKIVDFTKAGIVAKTITLDNQGRCTEDMKLKSVNVEELTDRNTDFEDSEIFQYFYEHSFLCPVFCEYDKNDHRKTTFLGFKRFSYNDDFIENEVRRTWDDTRRLIHQNKLKWEYCYDKNGNPIRNNSGSFRGAPNLPKSADYELFFRGGSNDSSDKARTTVINNIRMLPQFYWLRGASVAKKLKDLPFI